MRQEMSELKQLVAELSPKNRVLPAMAGRGKKLAGQGAAVRRLVRRSMQEKRKLIHLVGHSALAVGQGSFPRQDTGTVYRWWQPWQEDGAKRPAPRRPTREQFWDRIPEPVQGQIVKPLLGSPVGAGAARAVRKAAGMGFHRPGGLVCLGIKRFSRRQGL